MFCISLHLLSNNDIFISSSDAGQALIAEPCGSRVYLQSNIQVLTSAMLPLRPHSQSGRLGDETEREARGSAMMKSGRRACCPVARSEADIHLNGYAAFVITRFIMLIVFTLWGRFRSRESAALMCSNTLKLQ